jgi:hypothetical protein
MATTVAQPGTALKKIAKTYAAEAGMPVDQYLSKLKALNPDYSKTGGSDALRLGKGVGVQPKEGSTTGEPVQPGTPEFQVANILESPLYSQNLKDYYLTQYLPGLTQQTFDINQAQIDFQANEADRARQRGEAIKRVAGSYAARGMRSPAAINQDRSEIQREFGNLTRAEQNQIQALLNQRDVLYGAGATDSENFMSNPNLFGSIGAGARRASLQELQSLPEMYNLLGLNASTAPLIQREPTAVSAPSKPSKKPAPAPSKPSPKPAPKPAPPKPTPLPSRAAVMASEARRDAAMAARAPVRKK